MRKSLELYILWSELSRRKLSPTLANLASAHYSCPANAIVKVVVKYMQLEPLKLQRYPTYLIFIKTHRLFCCYYFSSDGSGSSYESRFAWRHVPDCK